mmetsp:Transcript_36337/g.67619  ORF Transcript_36337/g.67619 Transcript_36337/m.67619 type:complete len:86 (-) Transcript_36337:670-927(-)
MILRQAPVFSAALQEQRAETSEALEPLQMALSAKSRFPAVEAQKVLAMDPVAHGVLEPLHRRATVTQVCWKANGHTGLAAPPVPC